MRLRYARAWVLAWRDLRYVGACGCDWTCVCMRADTPADAGGEQEGAELEVQDEEVTVERYLSAAERAEQVRASCTMRCVPLLILCTLYCSIRSALLLCTPYYYYAFHITVVRSDKSGPAPASATACACTSCAAPRAPGCGWLALCRCQQGGVRMRAAEEEGWRRRGRLPKKRRARRRVPRTTRQRGR